MNNQNRFYTCTLSEGTSGNGRVLHKQRIEATSNDDARQKFCERNEGKDWRGYLLIMLGDYGVGMLYEDGDSLDYEDDEDDDDDYYDDEEDDDYHEDDYMS